VLGTPLVDGPLSPCSGAVRVHGQLPNAKVTVFASDLVGAGPPVMRTVASRVVVSTDAVIPLAAGISLKPHERVTAQQEKDSDIGLALPPELGVEVMAAPSAADLGGLFAPDTLLDCATCLWVAGAEPGATVTRRGVGMDAWAWSAWLAERVPAPICRGSPPRRSSRQSMHGGHR
jgi:hypothetical protein